VGRFCIPNGPDYVDEQTYEAFLTSFFGASFGTSSSQYFYDVGKSWPVILLSVLAAVIISYLYLASMKLLGGVLIWLSIALTASIFFAGGFYSYFYARL
jgi:hypothetical protein